MRDDHAIGDAYDDGRAAERLLIAASMLGLGAGIQWIRDDVLDAARDLLGLPPDRRVRTIIALGHPTEAASRPKAARGEARLPRDQAIYRDRWPGELDSPRLTGRSTLPVCVGRLPGRNRSREPQITAIPRSGYAHQA